MIEMRSDTFTLPSKEMLQTILKASLGDDVYGEDPTVKNLELICANMLGKEAAILMPSGTMANLASILAHCPRGSKLIVGDESDIYLYEAGGASICGGVIYEPIKTQVDGTLSIADIINALPKDRADPQFALPALICLENPHNRMGGIPLSLSYITELYTFVKNKGIQVHMDGARIFNSAIALNITAKEIAKYCDSLQFCLSKSLSAPIGSIVVGNRQFIDKVFRIRKMLGGGMRQAGIIAAPGIYAIQNMKRQLKLDHKHAKILSNGLSKIPGIYLNPTEPYTNMVFFTIVNKSVDKFIELCKKSGLNIGNLGHNRIRMVTHSGIDKKQINLAINIIMQVMNEK